MNTTAFSLSVTKKKPDGEALSEREFYALMLRDYGVVWDEGHDLYMDEMIAQIRTELDTGDEVKTKEKKKPAPPRP